MNEFSRRKYERISREIVSARERSDRIKTDTPSIYFDPEMQIRYGQVYRNKKIYLGSVPGLLIDAASLLYVPEANPNPQIAEDEGFTDSRPKRPTTITKSYSKNS
jgi:hypothetical protein